MGLIRNAVAGPVGQIGHRGRPHDIVAPAVFPALDVVRAVHIHALFPVVLKDARLSVRHVLPQRHIGIGAFDECFHWTCLLPVPVFRPASRAFRSACGLFNGIIPYSPVICHSRFRPAKATPQGRHTDFEYTPQI